MNWLSSWVETKPVEMATSSWYKWCKALKCVHEPSPPPYVAKPPINYNDSTLGNHKFSVFNTSFFKRNTFQDGIKMALHYQDHPLGAAYGDYVIIDSGTKNHFKVEVEEVTSIIFSLRKISFFENNFFVVVFSVTISQVRKTFIV